jgi:hypothetical protein
MQKKFVFSSFSVQISYAASIYSQRIRFANSMLNLLKSLGNIKKSQNYNSKTRKNRLTVDISAAFRVRSYEVMPPCGIHCDPRISKRLRVHNGFLTG